VEGFWSSRHLIEHLDMRIHMGPKWEGPNRAQRAPQPYAGAKGKGCGAH